MSNAAPPVLVTGANGFVGRAVVRRLRRAGIAVRAAGGPSATARDADLALDLRNPAQVRSAVEGTAAVIHLAAIGAPLAGRDPAATAAINTIGTQWLATAAAAAGVPRFLYASTHAVYADQAVPFDEWGALAPQGVYATTKLAGELHASAACAGTRTRCTTVRCFNLYGADAPAENVVQRFAAGIAAGRPVTLAAPANRAIDLLHVDDAAEAFAALLTVPTAPVLVNLGTGIGTPLDALAQMIGAQLGVPVRTTIDTSGVPYGGDRIASVARLQALLPRFAPRGVELGLTATLARHAA